MPRWRPTRILITSFGLVGGAIAAIATFSGHLTAIVESGQKLAPVLLGAGSGIEIRGATVARIYANFRASTDFKLIRYVTVPIELTVLNRGDKDASNCKVQLMFIDPFPYEFDNALTSPIPGHNIESRFESNFSIRREEYREHGSIRIACDGMITKTVPVTLPSLADAFPHIRQR